MIKLTIGVAAAVLLAVAPAMAKEKTTKHMKSDLSQEQSEMLKTEGQNREPGENGTFQGKPVVEGPANWKSAHEGPRRPQALRAACRCGVRQPRLERVHSWWTRIQGVTAL